jgi:hypothetical protein
LDWTLGNEYDDGRRGAVCRMRDTVSRDSRLKKAVAAAPTSCSGRPHR